MDYISSRRDRNPESLSELDVPVKIDNGVKAVINVESHLVNAFNQNDVKLLETLAGHMAFHPIMKGPNMADKKGDDARTRASFSR
jgi:putative methionine-R-sulfoxide reductase with GAF domain